MSQLAALFNAGRYADVESYARVLLGQYPNSGFVWKVLGASLQIQGKNALPSLLKATELSPDDAEAHNNLGNALRGLGQYEKSIACYRRALEIKSDFAEAHNNLGNALRDLGQHYKSIACYRRALEIKPDFADAHSNLGNVLQDTGQYENAESSYRHALLLHPNHALAHNNLGNVLRDMGKSREAEACYRRALQIQPDFVEALNSLGTILMELRGGDAAMASYRRALEIKPNYAEAHNNLGNVLRELGDINAATASYRRALENKPDYADAHNNLGNVLHELGDLDAALVSYRRALELNPNFAEAYNHFGTALKDSGLLEDALISYHRALKIKPDYVEAHNNLGSVLLDLGQLDNALASYRRALEIKPDYAEAHSNLGTALLDLSQLDDAIASFCRALEIKPDYVEAYGNLLFALNYHPDMSGEEIFAAYREYDEHYALPHRHKWRSHSNSRETGRRLKVGYVSPDFGMHPCRHFLEPLLAHHDKDAVEIYAYAELLREDAVTSRYREYLDHWIPTRGMTDDALAERIRADGIDILVDLAGHTGRNRLGVFTRKPAPVSLSWLGYGYTTGLSAIDYYLTDDACAPSGSEGLFSETPWRMKTPGFTFRPAEGMGEVNALPAIERGYITFGTLTRAVRINHRTIRVWSEILKTVPNSRLVIDSRNFKEPAMQERLALRFAEHGIPRERLEIGFNSPPWDVLRDMDIGLDCFPHNSGTTLFETLYMGVPYVTLAGRPSVGRLGSSVLEGAGHPEWIARTEEEYMEVAVALASDLAKLATVRSSLRHKIETGPLMDEAGFTRKVETAYRKMWQGWCQKED
ncbi:MAG: tetratricopeptide repeat protein [Thiohalomonadaceae bacterium]